ncbi:MAG TPA: hypothetical protein VH915_14300 [Pedococcus sp.]
MSSTPTTPGTPGTPPGPPSPHTRPRDGVRPLLTVGSPDFDAWTASIPEGHVLLLGEDAAIHRVACDHVAAAAGRPVVCSPDTLPLQVAMWRFEGEVVACGECGPRLDAPLSEFPRELQRGFPGGATADQGVTGGWS